MATRKRDEAIPRCGPAACPLPTNLTSAAHLLQQCFRTDVCAQCLAEGVLNANEAASWRDAFVDIDAKVQ